MEPEATFGRRGGEQRCSPPARLGSRQDLAHLPEEKRRRGIGGRTLFGRGERARSMEGPPAGCLPRARFAGRAGGLTFCGKNCFQQWLTAVALKAWSFELLKTEPHHRPPWRPKLSEWLKSSQDLKVSDKDLSSRPSTRSTRRGPKGLEYGPVLNEFLMQGVDWSSRAHQTRPVKACRRKERMLLRIFSGDDEPINELPETEQKPREQWGDCWTFLKTFVTYGGRKMDDLLRPIRWRVLAHLAAVLIAEPEKLTKDHPPFLPAMDEDIRRGFASNRSRVLKASGGALVERGENIWKFKSHWWTPSCELKCSCGFTFFIGPGTLASVSAAVPWQGAPDGTDDERIFGDSTLEVAKCPGCSLKIGGRDHNQTEHTFQDDESDPRRETPPVQTRLRRSGDETTSEVQLEFEAGEVEDMNSRDRSPWGYVLPIAEKDEKHVSFREVQSSSARAIRLMLHGTMYLGIIAAAWLGPIRFPGPMKGLATAESTMAATPESGTLKDLPESEYIGNHFHNDWKSMVEILSSNTEEGEDGKDEPLKPTEMGSKASWGVLTLLQRNSWEETIESKYLKGLIKNLDESLQDLYKKWGGDQEDGKFVAELKEAADVRPCADFPPQKREQEMPQLWAYRSPVTLDALHNKIGIAHNAKENFPVLCTILQNPLINILPALGTLVGVFEWQALCINQFSGRITKAWTDS
ncbi:Hypothetical protein SCF082_LOCUS45265 [Durusdinium trenchii]|uniref:Uncharacterized protein n=1 Tax=Durusdinium trenchii TaxID=1381693 RepID=A0ABP0R758_9DINO